MLEWRQCSSDCFFFLPESFVTITRIRIRRHVRIKYFRLNRKFFSKFVFFSINLPDLCIYNFLLAHRRKSSIQTFSTIVGTNFEDFEDSIGEFCASELSLNGRKRVEVGTSGFDVISISQREFGISRCFIARPRDHRGLLPTVPCLRTDTDLPPRVQMALEFEHAAGKCVKFRLGPVPA